MVMCHLWGDTIDELYAMADRIGVARRWLQRPPKASWTHSGFRSQIEMRMSVGRDGACH